MSTEKGESLMMTRRQFMKNSVLGLAGLTAGYLAGKYYNQAEENKEEKIIPEEKTVENKHTPSYEIEDIFDEPLPKTVEKEIVSDFSPIQIHGTEVYGINEPIDSLEDLTALYKQIDIEWERNNRIKIVNKYLQKKELLNPKERYLEVVVHQSAFDSFEQRIEETGVDFVEWIKLHVDSMNLCFEKSKPSSELKILLKRIIIVQDGTYDPIWKEEDFKNGDIHDNLDWRHKLRFCMSENPFVPIDTDESWAINGDYRDTLSERNVYNSSGYFWSALSNSRTVEYNFPPGGNIVDRTHKYINNYKSLKNRNRVALDFGMSHEWLHYAFNMPDEYAYDINIDGKGVLHLITGSFCEPWVSPYLSILSQNHIRKNLRNPYLEGAGVGYSVFDVPTKISIEGEDTQQLKGIKIARRGTERPQYFLEENDFSNKSNSIELTKDNLLKHDSCSLALEFENQQKNKNYTLYFPYMAFNMSYYSKKNNAKYKIEIISDNFDSKKTQLLHVLDESDIDKKIELLGNNPFRYKPIAKSKIDGTNAYYVWFQRMHP